MNNTNQIYLMHNILGAFVSLFFLYTPSHIYTHKHTRAPQLLIFMRCDGKKTHLLFISLKKKSKSQFGIKNK